MVEANQEILQGLGAWRAGATGAATSIERRLALFALVAAWLCLPARADAAGCLGRADYADELRPLNLQLVSETPAGEGFSDVVIGFDLSNIELAEFVSAQAMIKPTADAVALGFAPLQPAEFSAIAPHAQASPLAQLEVRVPSANVASLIEALASGDLPLEVHAEEQDVLAPGAAIAHWSPVEDAYYAFAREVLPAPINEDPGPPPYEPGEEFGISLIASFDGAGSAFDQFTATDDLWLVVGDHTPTEIPEALHYVRVVDVIKSDEGGADSDDGITTWSVVLQRTDTESLPSIYRSASFCTADASHIDLPIQATRLHSIDGDEQEAASRDSKPQPIHFNNAGIEGQVSFSGQMQGHALRPGLEIRLRDGNVRVVIDVDTDLSLTLEVRALAEASFDEPELLQLFDLCFPLPDLIAGPVPIGMNLRLEHVLGASGSIAAGAVVGVQKSFQSSFTVGYDDRRDEGDRYFAESPEPEPNPVTFTPPQLLDETGAHFEMSTEFRTHVVVGAKYPLCSTGVGGYVGARAGGSIDIFPTQDPWWRIGHQVEAFAGIDFQILGIEVAAHETAVELFAGKETLEADGPLLQTGGGGASAGHATTVAPAMAEDELLSGQDQRWGVAIDGITLPNGIEYTAVAALPTGGVALVSQEKILGRGQLLALDRYGALEWATGYDTIYQPRRVQVLPDGSILVAGNPAWAALHAADGSLINAWEFDVTDVPEDQFYCLVRSITPVDIEPTVSGFVAVGHHGRGDVRDRDACAFRFDTSGAILWARTYGDDGAQEFFDVMQASDGRIVAVGETEKGPNLAAENNPLFAVLDATDGSVIWARSLPTLARNMRLNAVAEAPSGTLFAAGGGLSPGDVNGAALIARIDPDGENALHALIFQDDTWEQLLPQAAFVDGDSGDTAFDEIFELIPVPGGFAFAGVTGLADASEAWVGKINERLGVEWLRSFDGDARDRLDGIALAEDGYFVSGFSGSLARTLEDTDTQGWLMKLTFEGGVEFGPEAGVRSRYISPGVRASSSDPGVVPVGEESIIAPLVEVDALETSTSTALPDLLLPPKELCLTRLGLTGRESEIDACEPEPVPEPGALAMFFTVVFVIGVLGRRR